MRVHGYVKRNVLSTSFEENYRPKQQGHTLALHRNTHVSVERDASCELIQSVIGNTQSE